MRVALDQSKRPVPCGAGRVPTENFTGNASASALEPSRRLGVKGSSTRPRRHGSEQRARGAGWGRQALPDRRAPLYRLGQRDEPRHVREGRKSVGSPPPAHSARAVISESSIYPCPRLHCRRAAAAMSSPQPCLDRFARTQGPSGPACSRLGKRERGERPRTMIADLIRARALGPAPGPPASRKIERNPQAPGSFPRPRHQARACPCCNTGRVSVCKQAGPCRLRPSF